MLRKLIVIVLMAPAIPVAAFLFVRANADTAKAGEAQRAAESLIARPAPPRAPGLDQALIAVRTAKADRLEAGRAVQVCGVRGLRLGSARVHAISCRAGQAWCAAFVRVQGFDAIRALAAYDFERPPTAIPGAGDC